eukprot:COSAG06_NODE_27317_length_595_cov_3.391129_1_plen_45_part_10
MKSVAELTRLNPVGVAIAVRRARFGAPTSIALIYINPLSYTIAPR